MSDRKQIEAFMGQIEELWSHQETLFQIIEAEGLWDRPHGPDWTYADVPYHLAYCNVDLVARPMELGRDLPADERLSLVGTEGVNSWNEQKFAERPADQTPAETMAQLHDSWDYIRQVTSQMTDADLERPFWLPFNGGAWQTAIAGLFFSRNHDWSEFMQLRIHMGRSEPIPSPEITTQYLQTISGFIFPMSVNQEAAKGRHFKGTFSFTDPGVEAFTVLVRDGAASIVPGSLEDADLVLTMSAETFESGIRGIQTMPKSIESGAIQVSDFEALAIFGQLFPMG